MLKTILSGRYENRSKNINRLGFYLGRNTHVALAVTLLPALLLGAAMLWHLRNIPEDGADLWSQIALNLTLGQGYVSCEPHYFPFCGPANQVTAAREPVPVLLFAALAWATGHLQPGGMVVELILNLAILAGAFSLARELGGMRPALLAGLIWGVYLPAMRLFYPAIAGDALATLGVTWALFFFLRAAATGRLHFWLISGACLGLGALSRTSVLILVPVLAFIALGWRRYRRARPFFSLRARLWPAALFLCAALIPVAPWAARNYLAFDRVVVGTTLGGYNLYRFNSPLLTDDFLRYVGPDEARGAVQALVARRPDLRGTENEAQMDAVYAEEALRIIWAAPARYLELAAYRFVLLWFNWRVPEAYGQAGIWFVDIAVMLEQGLLLLLGSIGMFAGARRALPLSCSIGAFLLLHLAVMGRLYLLMPVMPLVVVLSALGAHSVLQKLRHRRSATGWQSRMAVREPSRV